MASPSKRKRGRPKGSGKSPRKSTKRAETDDGERSAEGDGSLSLEPPERVLVIFCSKCNTIFGDTNSFVCTHDGLKTITLRTAYAVRMRQDRVETPTDGITAGSTSYPVHCDNCSQCVGKVFLSTTRRLDPMRDAFTFDSQAVKSYELSEGPAGAAAANGNGAQALAPSDSSSAAWMDRLNVLETQVLKVENLMLLFNERIDALEASQGQQQQGLR